MKNSKTYIIGGIAVVALGLIIWGTKSADQKPLAGLAWGDTNVPCLPGGHTNVARHIHQMLSISVDGVSENIPSHIGDTASCMAEVHTHDTTGKIHVETVSPDTHHTLADFFTVWGISIERPGFTLVATINGKVSSDPASHVLADDDVINLAYTKN